ncbi:MAG TPA: AMP-binding protein [Streptosporangiaceae bacterium]|jgi:crotonobetaine/carnitine-CoA ligase
MQAEPGAGSLVAALEVAAGRWADRVAWTFDPGERFTFGDVAALVGGYARALRERGVRPGDRVAVMLANEPAFPLTWLALSRIGAAMVPVNTKYQTADAGHVLRACGASLVVAGAAFGGVLEQVRADVPGLREVLPAAEIAACAGRAVSAGGPAGAIEESSGPDPASTANIQFTSGTTGPPKGCVLPHWYWTQLADGLITEFPYLTERDVMLTAQPFHYIDPQWNVAAGLLSGAELVILDGFHPSSFWAKVRQHRVSYFYCLGAMPTLLLRMPPDPADRDHAVRAVQCSAIPPALHAALQQRWGVPWYEAFGMTETGADLRVTDRDHDELVGTGCLGLPVSYRRVQIMDPAGQPVPTGQTGEIVLAGPGMMDGYLNDPRATARVRRDGWFHTGDLGLMDEAGRVYHTGRIKDMIRRSGENISAREVEEVLLTHPAVRLVAVTGVADEIRGEEAKAYYVTAGYITAGDADSGGPGVLADYCRARLAGFKVPRFWQPAADLPRTDSQRVAKARLAGLDGPVFDAVAGEWSPAAGSDQCPAAQGPTPLTRSTE